MNKEELIKIIKADQINADQLRQLDRLIDDYPWFGLPRFLRLKAMHQAGEMADPAEVSKAVVFSSDRGYLYRWIRGEAAFLQGMVGERGSELEFISDEDEDEDEMTGEAVTGSIDDPDGINDKEGDEEADSDGTDDDARERAIPEKEETEMEEPEMKEPESIPAIDPIDDEADQEEDESIADDSEEQMVTGGAAEERAEEDEAVEEAAAPEEAVRAPGRRSTAERFQEGPRKRTSGAANHSTSLIEQFLNSEPGVIKADKKTSLEGDVSKGSVQEDDSFITDTLAKIYVKQGLHAKAIYAYERLSLKYPEKSAYFAAQIEKIKNISNI